MDEEIKKMADKPLNELLSRDMVDIYVGPEETHWVLHEKLLCARSSFFRRIFQHPSSSETDSADNNANDDDDKDDDEEIEEEEEEEEANADVAKPSKPTHKASTKSHSTKSHSTKSHSTKSHHLPDDDPQAFSSFVSWLYSAHLPQPTTESDLDTAFDLYLLSARLEIPALRRAVLALVRAWYRDTDTYPGLRRVQYVYANTDEGSEMRGLLVRAVARMLVLGSGGVPGHWRKALRKNGQLAVDVIAVVQGWGLEAGKVPDARKEGEGSEGNGVNGAGEAKVEGKAGNDVGQDGKRKVERQEEKVGNGVKEVMDKELPNGLLDGDLKGKANGVMAH